MPDRTTTFSELVGEHLIEIGAGRPRTVNTNGHDLPILRVADVLDGRVEYGLQAHASNHDVQGEGSKVSRPGDIVLTTKGTVGRVALMPPDGPAFAYSPQLCFFRPAANGPLRSRFLYYWFKSAEFWIQANALKGQTDMADFLSLGDLQRMRIGIPSVDRQDAVVGVLGALDDKIAVNDRIATTGEALLRANYEALADGGELIAIGEIGSLIRDSSRPSDLADDEPYIGLEHMPRRSVWLDRWGSSAGVISQKTRFAIGDILFGKLRPYFHKVGLAQVSGVCSTDIMVIRPSSPNYLPWLLMALSSDEVVAHATARSDGTRMPRTRWSDLADFRVPWAKSSVVQRYTDLAHPLIKRVQYGLAESHRLAQLRDTLLPKLMSGRLLVKDAEKAVEEAI
ncbi:restriction endonuclease subunit S [Micromonospora globbae]|uniref:Restriction endonuclease subunit S n=1 Tax=Micromonospora globbae TaxID=1894969 RepID=A0A420F4R5_9ACTN|nr:restriction endonuclease subunit S [Micromonospora globbae]RKF27906.1 restriction endonuclease subunit S [Micromonospora globbae]